MTNPSLTEDQKLSSVKQRNKLIAMVDSGSISLEQGADGLWMRFDCDCTDALPYCQAQCCGLIGTFVFPEEIGTEVGKIFPSLVESDSSGRWVMKRDSDGFCHCLDRETRTCEIYSDRPNTCRSFHCTRGAEVRGWKFSNYVHRQTTV